MAETVKILSERKVQLPVAPGEVQEMVAITYAAVDLFPRTVYVLPENDTLEERQRLIRDQLEKARSTPPVTLELP